MPYEFTDEQANHIEEVRNQANARIVRKVEITILLLLRELSRQATERITKGQYPVPTGANYQWSQRLLAGQLAEGRIANMTGYNSSAELMRSLGTPSTTITENSLEFSFLLGGIDTYFNEAAKRQATTLSAEIERSFRERGAEQVDGQLKYASKGALAGAVQEDLEQFNQNYAQLVAMAGIVWASNEGVMRQLLRAGVTKLKWWTAEDERVCPFCAELHGTVITMGAAFVPAGERFAAPKTNAAGETYTVYLTEQGYEIQHPPVHVRCRCILLPYE